MRAEYRTFTSLKRRSSRACLAWLVVALSAMFLMPQAYGAADIYVSTNGVHATGPDWANPTSFTNALAIAAASDVIWMEQGSYTNASTFAVSTTGLQIYGGFDGTETLLSERDWTNNVVLLDGENSHCVIDIVGDNVLLDGLVITNGYELISHGAGVRVSGSTNLAMLNCRVTGNTIALNEGRGCGVYFNNAGAVLLSNCVIQANRATSRGNGIGFWCVGSTTLTLLDCEIRENYDSGGDQRKGKGFYLSSGTLIMVGTTVADNYTSSTDGNSGLGVGGYIAGGTAFFTNCVFTGNGSPNSAGSHGAGLYVNSGNVTIESSTFADNVGSTSSASPEGGAIYQASGTVTIKNSIFWDNQIGNDASDGDTIYQAGGTLNISYSCLDGIDLPRVRFINGTWGDGIITNNPLFVTDYTDLHLTSSVGRWDGSSWVTTDTTNSPCIDTGAPGSDYSNEPAGENGAWINMGAYGNTWQASKSVDLAPTVETVAERVVANAAELRGELTAGSVSTIIFYYGLSNGLEDPANWDATNILIDAQSTSNIFSSVAGGLQESQTYWFTVYATNDFGDDWGTPRSFATGTAALGGGAGVIHVDADAVGVPDGLSWTNAFTTFEAALAAADAGLGTNVWIAEATYSWKGEAFVIQTNSLHIYGGFDGTETLLSEQDWVNNVVLLDGLAMSHVVDIQADDVLLDGLVITNGYELFSHGAGVRMNNSGTDLTMLNCSVIGNTIALNGGKGGGAYFNSAGSVLLSNCVFQANRDTSRGSGSGFQSDSTTLTLLDCEILGNYGVAGDQRNGKGFYLGSGTLTMVGTTVADNYGGNDSNSGNGIGGYINGGTALFTNCVFTGNGSPGNTGGHGAGLYVNSGNVTIESCTFADNVGSTSSASPEGGAIYQANGTVTIRNSIFWDNQIGNDASDGDTIYQNAGTLNISYSCLDGIDLPRVRFVNGTWGDGIITNNPLFATDYTDVHLKSMVGRWDGSSWVTTDTTNSPCIDAGAPGSDYSSEPAGENGAWANIGAYGNTWQASKSVDLSPTVETVAERVVANAAELRGELTAGSVSTIIFYYGLSNGLEDPANWDATNTLIDAQSIGDIFTSVAGGLQESQTYWFTVYAANDFGDDWGTPRSFATGTSALGGGAGVIHVDADAVGVEEGLSWTNAFTTFEAALDAANDGLGSSIWVAEGTYQPQNTFVIQTNALSVYGGFSGTETSLSQRNWTNNECLLSGGGSIRVISIEADDALLDGLIITNGYIPSGGYHAAGLLMDNSGQNLTMINSRITGNYLASHDTRSCGAYFNNAGNVLLSNCVIRANQSTTRGNGTGFRSDNTTLTILDCEIRDNFDSGGDQRRGKGFYVSGGTFTMLRSTVISNYFTGTSTAGNGGGGYLNNVTAAYFTNCVFSGNRCQRSDGGGLYIDGGNVTIENCTFADNGGDTGSSSPEGGAIYQNSGTVTIKNSIFWDNQTGNDANDGDTIYQTSGDTMTISYSCIDGTNTPRVVALGTMTWGDGIITNNPLFATNYTDLHLMSMGGRWDGSSWVSDAESSPCIDAGDPASDYSFEPNDNGGRINMGAYGNTELASLSGVATAFGTVFSFR